MYSDVLIGISDCWWRLATVESFVFACGFCGRGVFVHFPSMKGNNENDPWGYVVVEASMYGGGGE